LAKSARSFPLSWFQRGIGVVILILLLLLILSGFWVVVPAGHVGVLLHFGAVRSSLSEGLHVNYPLLK